MRAWLARWIIPPFCDHKLKLVMSSRGMDTFDPETGKITPGTEIKIYQTCGLQPEHDGEHGGYQRLGRIRLRLGNWIYE